MFVYSVPAFAQEDCFPAPNDETATEESLKSFVDCLRDSVDSSKDIDDVTVKIRTIINEQKDQSEDSVYLISIFSTSRTVYTHGKTRDLYGAILDGIDLGYDNDKDGENDTLGELVTAASGDGTSGLEPVCYNTRLGTLVRKKPPVPFQLGPMSI